MSTGCKMYQACLSPCESWHLKIFELSQGANLAQSNEHLTHLDESGTWKWFRLLSELVQITEKNQFLKMSSWRIFWTATSKTSCCSVHCTCNFSLETERRQTWYRRLRQQPQVQKWHWRAQKPTLEVGVEHWFFFSALTTALGSLNPTFQRRNLTLEGP